MEPLATQPITELTNRGQRRYGLGAVAVAMLAMELQPLTPITPGPVGGGASQGMSITSIEPQRGRGLNGTILSKAGALVLDQMR